MDHEFFDDRTTDDVTDMPLRRGARVKHDRFGEGEVLSVVSVGEPAVVAFFPGWGEKKILARFLKPAGRRRPAVTRWASDPGAARRRMALRPRRLDVGVLGDPVGDEVLAPVRIL